MVSVQPDLVEIEELVRDSPRFKNQLAEWDREAAGMVEAAKRMIKSAENFLRANEEAVQGQALASDVEKFGHILTPTPEMPAQPHAAPHWRRRQRRQGADDEQQQQQ